jgi:hypothetical protein
MSYIGRMNIAKRLKAASVVSLSLLALVSTSASASSATPPKQPTISLASPSFALPMTSARAKLLAAGAYVHLANCQSALQGANGDNDIASFIVSKSPVGIRAWAWSGSTRYANDDVIAWIDFYNQSGWVGNAGGHCWGSDANITDRVEGW